MTTRLSRRAALIMASLGASGLALGGCSLLRWLWGGGAARRGEYAARFDCGRYNELPSIEDAYQQLTRVPGYRDQLLAGVSILGASPAREALGLLLLHRHFRCGPDTLMLEHAAKTKDGWLYLTAPAGPEVSARASFAPSRFLVSSDESNGAVVLPLEFSTDERVRRRFEQISGDDALLGDLARFLRESPIGPHLGVAITERAHRKRTSVALEKTQLEPSASVVRYVRRSRFEIGRAIPTIWSSRQVNGCCSIETYCEAFCVEAMVGSGHSTGHVKTTSGHIGCV